MFGLNFVKAQPTEYLLLYRRGKLVRSGAGLSAFYFAPTAALVLVPVGSVDEPFIFTEVTADFQEVTVQGQLTYRITDPERIAGLLNYTLDLRKKTYVSEDPQKLAQRLINHARVLTRTTIKQMKLRDALAASNDLIANLRQGMQASEVVASLGIEIMDLSILAVRPVPETARALEAEAREDILKAADEAVYSRRNAAVEQERAIKENELNTEIAVENKKRQIRETQLETEKMVQHREHELKRDDMTAQIGLEKQNKDLVTLATENRRQEADANAYALEAVMKSLSQSDPRMVQALASLGMDSNRLIALAFRDLAGSAEKIGQLNVSPDLLRELLQRE